MKHKVVLEQNKGKSRMNDIDGYITRNRLSLDEQTTLIRNFFAIVHPIPILTS